jgi:RNA polymerase sigma factor (TIGR02999 family)
MKKIMAIPAQEITQLLLAWSNGDRNALDRLVPLVHQELRRLARYYMRREREDHTLQTSALINEAYIRLVDYERMRWQDRAHFFAVAARAMRRILVDYARTRRYQKRGGNERKVSLDQAATLPATEAREMIDLNEALTRLSELDSRKGQIIELRYFGGLSIEETAEVMGLSPATVKREWNSARLWLRKEIARES